MCWLHQARQQFLKKKLQASCVKCSDLLFIRLGVSMPCLAYSSLRKHHHSYTSLVSPNPIRCTNNPSPMISLHPYYYTVPPHLGWSETRAHGHTGTRPSLNVHSLQHQKTSYTLSTPLFSSSSGFSPSPLSPHAELLRLSFPADNAPISFGLASGLPGIPPMLPLTLSFLP